MDGRKIENGKYRMQRNSEGLPLDCAVDAWQAKEFPICWNRYLLCFYASVSFVCFCSESSIYSACAAQKCFGIFLNRRTRRAAESRGNVKCRIKNA